MKKIWIFKIIFMMTILTLPAQKAVQQTGGKCLVCHKEKTPGLYLQWQQSAHAQHNVTCIECHGAQKGDKDGFEHEGALIATLVTPKDCGACHEKETREVSESYHASAGEILESADAYLAHVAAGEPAAILGCESCHGAKIRIDPRMENRLSQKSWPNSGIGRINPDGSKGSCNACHSRHIFSKAQARQPESCAKCHLGPDHPQKEIYEESKHGNAYYTQKEMMGLSGDRWIVGRDYAAAPTCATCHMSATTGQKVTHDVGNRLKWTLRPVVSKFKKEADTRRTNMKDVCMACHGKPFAEGHFTQFDAAVHLYNDKFAKPAQKIMQMIQEKKLLKNKAGFSNKIEWEFWELWHHEGRRARHGAAMMGPDYTWWHGFYDVAHNFYFKFIPEAQKYNDPQVNKYIDDLFQNDPKHRWLRQETGELKKGIRSGKHLEIYKKMFQQD